MFIDVKDLNSIQLKSNTKFVEIFKKKNDKSDIIIPQTIIFEQGNPTTWFFNSKKEKRPYIMKKGSAKTNTLDLAKTLINIKIPEDFRIDNILTLKEYLHHNVSKNDKNYVAFARYSRQDI